jgi:hypothetical protein
MRFIFTDFRHFSAYLRLMRSWPPALKPRVFCLHQHLTVVVQAGLIGTWRAASGMVAHHQRVMVMTAALLAWGSSAAVGAGGGDSAAGVVEGVDTVIQARSQIGRSPEVEVSWVSPHHSTVAGSLHHRRCFLLQKLGLWAPGVFSATLMVCALILAYWRIVLPSHSQPVAVEANLTSK